MSRHMELVLKIKNKNGVLQFRFHKKKTTSLIKIYGPPWGPAKRREMAQECKN